jgi:hypothetical protein
MIYEFELKDDTIKKYYSPVYGSDIPAPLAVGDKNIYLLNYNLLSINKNKFPKKMNYEDSYLYFEDNQNKSKIEKDAVKIKTKILQKRIFG